MQRRRRILFSAECESAAARIGGFQRIDESLAAGIYDALERNPYGFPLLESDWFTARMIATKPFRSMPALVWLFVIDENKDIVITHVQEFEDY